MTRLVGSGGSGSWSRRTLEAGIEGLLGRQHDAFGRASCLPHQGKHALDTQGPGLSVKRDLSHGSHWPWGISPERLICDSKRAPARRWSVASTSLADARVSNRSASANSAATCVSSDWVSDGASIRITL